MSTGAHPAGRPRWLREGMTTPWSTPAPPRPGTPQRDAVTIVLAVANVLAFLLAMATVLYCVGWFMAPGLEEREPAPVLSRYGVPLLLAALALVPAVVSIALFTSPRRRVLRLVALAECVGLCVAALVVTAELPPFEPLSASW